MEIMYQQISQNHNRQKKVLLSNRMLKIKHNNKKKLKPKDHKKNSKFKYLKRESKNKFRKKLRRSWWLRRQIEFKRKENQRNFKSKRKLSSF